MLHCIQVCQYSAYVMAKCIFTLYKLITLNIYTPYMLLFSGLILYIYIYTLNNNGLTKNLYHVPYVMLLCLMDWGCIWNTVVPNFIVAGTVCVVLRDELKHGSVNEQG